MVPFAIAVNTTTTNAREEAQKLRWETEVNVPLRRMLDQSGNFCVLCYLQDRLSTDHAMDACPHDTRLTHNDPDFKHFRDNYLKFPRYNYCFGCSVSTQVM